MLSKDGVWITSALVNYGLPRWSGLKRGWLPRDMTGGGSQVPMMSAPALPYDGSQR